MLKVLPEQISNLIAAGEVVQRPASVVKELMENAVDAGATRIQVIVNDAGRTLIQVLDNGCGMSREEAQLSFQRHATSKISTAEDLHHILTYGFRGEALASVAACAEVTMITRREGDETAAELQVSESRVNSVREVSAPKGTNIAVRNLFYNVPARRKFLKSDNTEMRQIVMEFTKVAITRREVEFKLIHNSKVLFNLAAVANLKQRIVQIEGMAAAKDLVDVNVKTSVVSIWGYAGNPLLAKKSQQNQYLFVNGRYFRSALFNKAILKAYDKLLPEGLLPSYYLFFEVNPEETDVNIHPAKTEVKFENESVIFNILNCAVKEAIGVGAFMPGINFEQEGVPELPAIDANLMKHRASLRPPQVDYNPLFNPFDEEKSFHSESKSYLADFGAPGVAHAERVSPVERVAPVESLLPVESIAPVEESPNIVIGGRYIVTALKSGLAVINVARARERIMYERYLKSMEQSVPAVQESLFPQTLDLTASAFRLLTENDAVVRRIGFDLRPFGDNCIVIYGIPALFADEKMDMAAVVDDIIDELGNSGELGGENEGEEALAERLFSEFKERLAARMSGRIGALPQGCLHSFDTRMIVESLFACENPYVTPSGKSCVQMITVEELEKRFNF